VGQPWQGNLDRVYNPAMKAYVTGYQSKKQEKTGEKTHFGPHEGNVDVIFHKQVKWRMESVEEAKAECGFLQGMKVRVGEHYCELSVEQLPGGNFAIVCLSHPDWVK
jgi:hypothetical protein